MKTTLIFLTAILMTGCSFHYSNSFSFGWGEKEEVNENMELQSTSERDTVSNGDKGS